MARLTARLTAHLRARLMAHLTARLLPLLACPLQGRLEHQLQWSQKQTKLVPDHI